MNKDEAASVIEEAEEVMGRLPAEVGACFFVFDAESGINYTSNLDRATVIALLKQFIARNTQ